MKPHGKKCCSWYLNKEGLGSPAKDAGLYRLSKFGHTRNSALSEAFLDDIDPFEAALGFEGYYLAKMYSNWDKIIVKKYSLTEKEKAFLLRRISESKS
jgi:hypothetical protein